MKNKLTRKQRDTFRDAYESYRKQRVGLHNLAEYKGWMAGCEYMLTNRKKDLAELLDEYYNSEEGIEFMRKNGGLKDE